MPGEKYEHLFIPAPTNTIGFTNPRAGGSEPRIPYRDKTQHSNYLLERLQNTWEEFDNQREVVFVNEREGAYFDFVSEPGYELSIKSLEDRRQNIRLRNVRVEGEGDEKRTFATVFVPLNKRSHFFRKLNVYATELTQNGNPKNSKLVNSISNIRLAVLESFWHSNERSMIPQNNREWVELWLSIERGHSIDDILSLLSILDIETKEESIEFPERIVKLIFVNRIELEQLIQHSDDIAEFRVAKQVTSFFSELENQEQVELVNQIIERTTFNRDNDVSVCILDAGVNNGHILIQPILQQSDMHTVKSQWGIDDSTGHGTLMAGTSAYGDLLEILNNGTTSLFVDHVIESAKILPPPPIVNPKELWGFFTSEGISRAEIQSPYRKRIICLAITSDGIGDRGRPSSWSGAVDELASGYEDDKQRLIIISAGNVEESDQWRNYFIDNLTNEIHDPAQAWNALTIGAYTKKNQILEPSLQSYSPIAPFGGLSPFSTTSTLWSPRKWPIKPEVLFEGGNVAKGPNDSIIDTEDLKLISTYYKPHVAQLAPFCATSAASAQAAYFAAQIQVQYPEAWPETIRALIVHSATWTEEMLNQFLPNQSKSSYAKLLRICGYGVPDLDRALYCLSNSLTLVSQATLQPYDKQSGRLVTRDMHLYDLPWPIEILSELGEKNITMRVTLSYFVEPSPSEIGWDNRYRYASHALRFDMNGAEESEDEFMRRVNRQSRDENEYQRTEGVSQNWVIGEARNVGSIHSDIWKGSAADLAGSHMIAVYPAVGWWRERSHLGRWDKQCRYTLIVSIYTEEQEIDIYTPIAIQLGITVPIEIPIR